MAHFFTVAELEAAKLWHSLTEIRRMGGVENTPRGWAATYAAAPGMWYTPVVAAWQLHRAGRINCPDLPWRIARIALRDQPHANAQLREWAPGLSEDTWRQAYRLGQQLGKGAYKDPELKAIEGCYALYCAHDAAKLHSPQGFAADAIQFAAYYAAGISGTDAVKHEIVAMAVEAMATMN